MQSRPAPAPVVDTESEWVLVDPEPVAKQPTSQWVADHRRPSSVIPLYEDEGDDSAILDELDIAVIRVPAKATHSEMRVLNAVCNVTNARLREGWSLEYALNSAALGGDMIAKDLATRGIKMDPKTVRVRLKRLVELGCLAFIGQLPDWIDPSEARIEKVCKSGAFLYRLKITFRKLGQRAIQALIRLSTSSYFSLEGKKSSRRGQGALRWALKHAQKGTRNYYSLRLAWTCLKAGVTKAEAAPLMVSYCAQIPQPPAEPYTPREAMRTLESVYRGS